LVPHSGLKTGAMSGHVRVGRVVLPPGAGGWSAGEGVERGSIGRSVGAGKSGGSTPPSGSWSENWTSFPVPVSGVCQTDILPQSGGRGQPCPANPPTKDSVYDTPGTRPRLPDPVDATWRGHATALAPNAADRTSTSTGSIQGSPATASPPDSTARPSTDTPHSPCPKRPTQPSLAARNVLPAPSSPAPMPGPGGLPVPEAPPDLFGRTMPMH